MFYKHLLLSPISFLSTFVGLLSTPSMSELSCLLFFFPIVYVLGLVGNSLHSFYDMFLLSITMKIQIFACMLKMLCLHGSHFFFFIVYIICVMYMYMQENNNKVWFE